MLLAVGFDRASIPSKLWWIPSPREGPEGTGVARSGSGWLSAADASSEVVSCQSLGGLKSTVNGAAMECHFRTSL